MDGRVLFEILVREHADMLTAYLRSLIRDPGTIDDLFQETMLTAWRRIGDYDRSRPFGPWLRGIAARLVMSHRRKVGRVQLTGEVELLECLDTRFAQLERQAGDTFDEKLNGLRRCLDSLAPPDRVVIQGRYRDDIPVRDLAQILKISHEALKKRLQRLRARLIDCIQRKLAHAEAPS